MDAGKSSPGFSHPQARALPPLRLLHRATAALLRLSSTPGGSLCQSIHFLPLSLPLRFLSPPLRLRFAGLGRRPPHRRGLLGRRAHLVHSALEVPQGSPDSNRQSGSLEYRPPARSAPTPVRDSSRGSALRFLARAPALYPGCRQPVFSRDDAAHGNIPPGGHRSSLHSRYASSARTAQSLRRAPPPALVPRASRRRCQT